MFKVGQKVKIVKTNWSGSGKGEELNKTGYIVDDLGRCGEKRWEVCRTTIGDENYYLGLYNDYELEPMEEREFQKGDRVVGKKSANDRYSITNDGFEGIITDINSFEIELNDIYWVDPQYFELIESPKKKEVAEEKTYAWQFTPELTPTSVCVLGQTPNYTVAVRSPKPKKRMPTLSNIAKKILDPDLRALVEVGYLDSELELTDEGEEAVLELMFFANKEELAKQAKKELKERKKDK